MKKGLKKDVGNFQNDGVGTKYSNRFLAYDSTPCEVTVWIQSDINGQVLHVGVYDYITGENSVGRSRFIGGQFMLQALTTVGFAGLSASHKEIVESDLWPRNGEGFLIEGVSGVVRGLIESALASGKIKLCTFHPKDGGKFSEGGVKRLAEE